VGEWLEPTDQRWHATLREAPHDVYHLPGYAELAGRTEVGIPRAFYAEIGHGRILIPLLLRPLKGLPGAPEGARDAASPYGYGGPVFTPELADSDLGPAFEAFRDDGARAGLVTSFIRTHPLLRQVETAELPEVRVVTHGSTVSVDLTLDADALDQHVRAEFRRNIAKLRAAGFQTQFDAWDQYAAFQAAYACTMERHQAASRYRFDAAYFARLRANLGSALHLCSVVGPAGDLACAGLFTEVDDIVQYHLSASVERHRSMAPTKLMLYDVRTWAKERGAVVLHLGGGVGGKGDSLYWFKRGFGTTEHVFRTINVVHHPEAYELLTNHWLQAHQRPPSPDDAFFPLYRSVAPVA
jgi:hypothetical protein